MSISRRYIVFVHNDKFPAKPQSRKVRKVLNSKSVVLRKIGGECLRESLHR